MSVFSASPPDTKCLHYPLDIEGITLTLHGKPYFPFPDVLKRWSFQKNCAGT